MSGDFEAVIGLEVHVQLATESKIFCSSRARLEKNQSSSDLAVNGCTCEICTGHPGTLPVINKRAVEYAVRAGLATHCQINLKSIFARKNYFYPDLAKGYQISQYELPLCENGWIFLDGKEEKKITIQRIHMEEDAGKTVHLDGESIVNYNRAGTPLIEVVSGPEMTSSAEAGSYLRALYSIVSYLGICDGNLQEGNFRCDANVSVKPKGQKELGTRTECKNINSFKFVEKAIDFEISRQVGLIQSGQKVVQETRGYDSDKNTTFSMRSKEDAHDYRYFPDPDLLPLVLDSTWVDQIKTTLPELPQDKMVRFQSELGLSEYDARLLVSSKGVVDVFEACVSLVKERSADLKSYAKTVTNLLNGEIARISNELHKDVSESKITAPSLVDLVKEIQSGAISSSAAKVVLEELWSKGGDASKIIDQKKLRQESDQSVLEPIVDEVIQEFPDQVSQYKSGKDKLMSFFVGQCMKKSRGKGNPGVFNRLLKDRLGGK